MKTKCIVLGEEKKPEHEPKKIEFVKWIDNDGVYELETSETALWDTIELVAKDYSQGMDLIFAHRSKDRTNGCAYLGHWNDGVV